jgi:hypothetical protein
LYNKNLDEINGDKLNLINASNNLVDLQIRPNIGHDGFKWSEDNRLGLFKAVYR